MGRSHHSIPGWVMLSQAAMIANGELPRKPAQAIKVFSSSLPSLPVPQRWFVAYAGEGERWKSTVFSTEKEAQDFINSLGLPLTPTTLEGLEYSRHIPTILSILKEKTFPPKRKEQEVSEFVCKNLTKEQLRQVQVFVGAAGCSRSYPFDICNTWRHRATGYDRNLSKGGDVLTETIKAMTEFIEVLQFYKANKDYILSADDCKTDALRYDKKMALLDHDLLIKTALAQISRKRRKQEELANS